MNSKILVLGIALLVAVIGYYVTHPPSVPKSQKTIETKTVANKNGTTSIGLAEFVKEDSVSKDAALSKVVISRQRK